MSEQNCNVDGKLLLNKRIEYVDVAKGLAMLLVIYGHCMYYTGFRSIINFIYSFHMPFFFLISGYFLSANKSFYQNLRSKVKTVLFPYFATALLGSILLLSRSYDASVSNLIDYLYASSCSIESLGINKIYYIWFLLALFHSTVIGHLFLRMDIIKAVFFVAMLSALTYVLYNVLNISTIPWFFLQGLFAVIYVYAGVLCKRYHVFSTFSLYPIAFACVVYLSSVSLYQEFSLHYIDLPRGIATLIASFSGVYLFVASSKLIASIPYISAYLRIFGTYSLIVLCVHQIIHFYLPGAIIAPLIETLSFISCPHAAKMIIVNIILSTLVVYAWDFIKRYVRRMKEV